MSTGCTLGIPHPEVATVHYPGLASHAGHAAAKDRQAGFGAMLGFELVGGAQEVERFVELLQVFALAESPGGAGGGGTPGGGHS
jgi:cystathionine gamma-synthase